MNADGAFRMGNTHAICQDYLLAQSGESPRVLLADGCSSSPDTDIGARLLVRLAEQQHKVGEGCLQDAVVAARRQAALLGLEDRALDATLLKIWVEGEQWIAEMHGDGVLAWADAAGLIHAVSLTYSGGYPYYPNYVADPGRRAAFLLQADNDRKREEIVLMSDGARRSVILTTDPASSPCYRRTGDVKETRWIAVLSDGIHSFVQTDIFDGRPTTVPVSWHTALCELLAFKNWNGAFVQRRLQRFLLQCEARRWQHRDDLAVGAIGIES